MVHYPRVLFVTPLAFNHFTGGGVTFSNLFRGWPMDRLFTVHADCLRLSTDVCVNYYALGPDELPLAWPFETLRRRAGRPRRDAVEAGNISGSLAATPAPQASVLRRVLFKLAGYVFGPSGFPVEARLSDRLAAWIEAAKPDVIYTILGSIEMMEMVETIRVKCGLPVVVHLMDDWRRERERYGLLSPWRRRRLNCLFDAAMRTARGHLAICDAMAKAYGDEYGVKFEAIQNVIDTDAWLALAPSGMASATPARLLYAGSLYRDVQLTSLLDIALAVSRLRAAGMAISLDIMCPDFMMAPLREQFHDCDGTRIVAQVAREHYFETIRAADVLLLPVNFAPSAIRMVRYSMPTKVPEYLVSGVPVLLYGPDGIAQIDYATDAGWGHVVARRDEAALDTGIRRIVEDRALRQGLVARARSVAASRHDSAKVRDAFVSALRSASVGEATTESHCEAK